MGDSSNDDSVEVMESEQKIDMSESLRPKLIRDFAGICDVTSDEAKTMLENHNWDMEEAVNVFFEKKPLAGRLEVADVLIDLDDPLKTRLVSDLSAICEVTPAMAREMLELQKWNMQASIDKLLNQESNDSKEEIDVNNLDKAQEVPNESSATNVSNSGATTSQTNAVSPTEVTTWAPSQFTMISWNLDGLDSKNLERRTESVVDTIEKDNYSIVFFQEMLPHTFHYVATRLASKYYAIPGTDDPSCGYLTATFLRLQHIIYEDHYIVKYPNTSMERNVLVTRAFSGRAKLYLLNTHLESTADFATERINQLAKCFNLCRSFPPEYNVIFGGDLNLRDKEVVGHIPNNMCDLWEKCGARASCRYTWDLKRNTNKRMPSSFQPSCRFDRLYFRESEPLTITPEFFGITGIEKVAGTQSFPSDHWAIISAFRLEQEARKPQARKRKSETSP